LTAIVIAGAGMAGGNAVKALRREGYDGGIVLIGDEPGVPFGRPPLSKTYLRGDESLDGWLVRPPHWYESHDVDFRRTAITRIDPVAHRVELGSGGSVEYDRLLIATGGRNRRLQVVGAAGVDEAAADRLAGPGQALAVGRQGGLVLARDHAVDQPPDREVAADGRVEAVETEGELGPLRPQRLGGPQREAHRGVHRDREGDGLAPPQPLRIPALDCEVEAADLVAGAAQGGGRRGDVQGLVPELVRGDQYDTHRPRLAARGRRQRTAAAAGARMSTSRRA